MNPSSNSAPVPAVALRGVSKRFESSSSKGNGTTAVDELDLDIADGEFFALLGPSGCGKTTTLRMIAGLELPTSGSIEVFGADVAQQPAHRRPVNTVFQDYALFPHLDIAANVGFGLKMQKVAKAEIRERVAESLEMVRMDGLDKRRPSEISGGQRQRVALARAIVNRPRVLLLDEPLGALDLQLRRDMQTELKMLQRELGIAFVFVTHDQEEALSMSDRIGIMDRGRLLQVDTPEGVYERPADLFVAGFVGQTNLLDATVVDPRTICLANGARLAIDNDAAPGTEVNALIRPERARLEPLADATTAQASSSADGASLEGVIDEVTYLGNAVVYRVALDWMSLDVRMQNSDHHTVSVGTAVRVTWSPDAMTLVTR